MSPLDIIRAVNERRGTGDIDGAIAVLRDHPEFFEAPEEVTSLLHYAARAGEAPIVSELIRGGAAVDAIEHPLNQRRALGLAATANSVATVRLLLDSGAEVNWGWEVRGADGAVLSNHPVCCIPLQIAIHHGHTEIAKLLIDAGALVNAVDKQGMTHLDWAERFGRGEVADYLRARGARRSGELPGYVAPPEPEPHPVTRYADSILGSSSPVPDDLLPPGPVGVRVRSHRGDPCYLVTEGLSDRPLADIPGSEADRFAELCVGFDTGLWPEGGDWGRGDRWWIVAWLTDVAHTVRQDPTWLGEQYGILTNGDPPEPLSESTGMTGWLLLAGKGPLERATLDDGRTVVFYKMLPVHTAEADLVLREGSAALLEKFARQDVPDHLVPDRPSAV